MKYSRLNAIFLGMCFLFFAAFNTVKAQNLCMNHSGIEQVSCDATINFYDEGGPALGFDYHITFAPKTTGDRIKVTPYTIRLTSAIQAITARHMMALSLLKALKLTMSL